MAQIGDPEPAAGQEDDAIIIAAVDTSASAPLVLETAARLARRNWSSAQLHIAHVFRTKMSDSPPGGPKDDDLMKEAKNYLDHHVRMAEKQCSSPVTGHFAVGDPSEQLVSLATSLNATVLVLGTHDAVGIERLQVGSVAETILRKAPCSVFVVRGKGKGKGRPVKPSS
jgi:nucleotide-binding universal stress UspA family protein